MRLKTYHPHPKFPPISLSGGQCQLNCLHCNRTYLRNMTPAQTPEDLVAACRALRDAGAIGALLSGGSTRDGRILNLKGHIEAIRQVKAETGLILNLHPGLMDEATARALGPVIDFASLEIPSDATIRDVFRLQATRADYVATYDRLREAGMHVVPHVAIYNGSEDQLLTDLAAATRRPPPETIVVIVFSPTRDTPMAQAAPPAPELVGETISRIKTMFPEAEIALGCMRPRNRNIRTALELAALDAGVVRMELPSRATLDTARARGYAVTRFDACCALPVALEGRARHAEPLHQPRRPQHPVTK